MEKFLDYVKEMWPEFLCGPHHELMARKFEEVADGKIKRLILNLPPRYTKSMFASYMLPSWYLGRFPEKKVIQTAANMEQAVSFRQRVDRLMRSKKYAQVFPKHGKTVCTAAGGSIGGYCADLYIVDDPHMYGHDDFDSVFDWFTESAMCRLNPEGAMVVVMSRSSEENHLTGDKDDLTGRLEKFGGWEIVKIPAMKSDGSSAWPEFWPEERLLGVKQQIPPAKWRMEYQSNNEAG